jgi:cytochrome P450
VTGGMEIMHKKTSAQYLKKILNKVFKGKRGKKYINQVKESGNRWWDTMNNSSNEKFYEQFESKIK